MQQLLKNKFVLWGGMVVLALFLVGEARNAWRDYKRASKAPTTATERFERRITKSLGGSDQKKLKTDFLGFADDDANAKNPYGNSSYKDGIYTPVKKDKSAGPGPELTKSQMRQELREQQRETERPKPPEGPAPTAIVPGEGEKFILRGTKGYLEDRNGLLKPLPAGNYVLPNGDRVELQ